MNGATVIRMQDLHAECKINRLGTKTTSTEMDVETKPSMVRRVVLRQVDMPENWTRVFRS